MSNEQEQDKVAVRDFRGKYWFWADHDVIDIYGPVLGAYPIAVYMYLARRVDDKEQKCWPSYQTIANALKISRPTAIYACKDLEACGLIRIEERKADDGHQSTNYFILQPSEMWIEPGSVNLPSLSIKKSKRELEQGKQRLPGGSQRQPGSQQEQPAGTHGASPSKRKGTQGLPKQETSEQKTSNKKQQQRDVDSAKNSSIVGLQEQEYSDLSQRLIKLRVAPGRAPYLLNNFPENVRRAVAWWEANPKYWNERSKPGGAVASSIEKPESYPQIYNEPEAEAPEAPARRAADPAARAAAEAKRLDSAYKNAAASEKLKIDIQAKLLKKEGKGTLEECRRLATKHFFK